MILAFDPKCLTRWTHRWTICTSCGMQFTTVFPQHLTHIECSYCRHWTTVSPPLMM